MHSNKNSSTREKQIRTDGLRSIRLWVPDTRSPEFREQVRQQCISVASDLAEKEALAFTEQAASYINGWE